MVLDTIYDSYALVCTCQDVDLFFTSAHRRSCSILQRKKEEDLSITQKMYRVLDEQVEDASHDFDKINQEDCEHEMEKKLSIDVDKILGLAKDETESGDDVEYDDYYGDYEPDAEVLTAQQVEGMFR